MPLLEIKDVTLNFGGLAALNHVSMHCQQGDIYAIIGPNGAGKSTLFNCVTGLYKNYGGEILFQEKDITPVPPHQIAVLGIARTYQNLELFSKMTLIENIMVGFHYRVKTNLMTEAFRFKSYYKQENHFREKAYEIIELLKISKFRNRLITELPYGTLKRVEIGRALAMEPTLLLLDEPTSGMNEQETEEITELIFELNQSKGITVLLVEHDMSVVMGISNFVYVLNYGVVISNGPPKEIQRDPEVIKAFLGGD